MIFLKIKSNNWFLSFSFHYFLLEEHVLPRTWLVPVFKTQQIHQNRISKQWNQNQNKSYQSEIKPIKHMKKKKSNLINPSNAYETKTKLNPSNPYETKIESHIKFIPLSLKIIPILTFLSLLFLRIDQSFKALIDYCLTFIDFWLFKNDLVYLKHHYLLGITKIIYNFFII